MTVGSKITGNSVGSATGMQSAVVYFPEHTYKSWRRIERLPGVSPDFTLEFPPNLYSIYKSRIHFTPIWFPYKDYKVYIETLDAWIPAGIICDQLTTASIMVKGSVWDDWHVGIVPELPY